MVSVCGLDPSLCGFGASVGKETIVISTDPNDSQSQYQNLQRRCQEIIAKILMLINRNIPPDDEIMFVIESPSYGSQGGLVEAGWMMCELFNRLPAMTGRKCSVLDVAPPTLKKFVTGSGRADKTQMAKSIKERWNTEFERDKGGNAADAYGLYRFGLAVLDGEYEYTRSPRRGKGGKRGNTSKDTKGSRSKSSQDGDDLNAGRGRRTRKTSTGK